MDAPTISTGHRSRARVTLVALALTIGVTVLSAQAWSIWSTSPIVRPAAPMGGHRLGDAPVIPEPRGSHEPKRVHRPNSPGIVAAAGPGLASPEGVLFTSKDEHDPAVSDGYLMWAQNGTTFVKPDGEDRIRVNPRGTQSYGGGIDGATAVFAQTVHHQDDLFMYDVATDTISDPPVGVNTSAFEIQPSLSGDWLLFARVDGHREEAILFDVVTLEQRVLTSLRYQTHGLLTDQVNGDWATWESCDLRRRDNSYSNCQAFRYQISEDATEQLPNPDRQEYAAGVAPDGTAYLIRTGRSAEYRCGARTRIVRVDPNDDTQIVASLPNGIDSLSTFAFEETDGSTTLYFERDVCVTEDSDIYRITDADTAGSSTGLGPLGAHLSLG